MPIASVSAAIEAPLVAALPEHAEGPAQRQVAIEASGTASGHVVSLSVPRSPTHVLVTTEFEWMTPAMPDQAVDRMTGHAWPH